MDSAVTMDPGLTPAAAPDVASAEVCDLFAREWLASTLRTYPAQAQGVLAQAGSPFRNPVGSVLREALIGLTGELFGAFDASRVRALVDRVVRLRAVQDFTPSEVTEFVTFARAAVTRVAATARPPAQPGTLERVRARIEALTPIADDCASRCRDDLRAITERAARRRVFLFDRMQARAPRHPAAGPSAATRGQTS